VNFLLLELSVRYLQGRTVFSHICSKIASFLSKKKRYCFVFVSASEEVKGTLMSRGGRHYLSYLVLRIALSWDRQWLGLDSPALASVCTDLAVV
jgi:hypothetical protein